MASHKSASDALKAFVCLRIYPYLCTNKCEPVRTLSFIKTQSIMNLNFTMTVWKYKFSITISLGR